MKYNFDEHSIKKISDILQAEPSVLEKCYTWTLESTKSNLPNTSVTIFTQLTDNALVMVSAHTAFGYYELHNVLGWSRFQANEVVFFAENNDTVSAMFVSSSNNVTLYSNVDKRFISEEDISIIDPALLLSVMQLSVFKNDD